ncbi:hypothetical protein [Anaerofustis butyriciformans]|uniref:hypothetical protein n=1 Tax=Anaerofustis butyriciformans TaxID=3108533 RepID=UPI002E31ED05|nr:hypothetical protein [Anaerofustis sp. HA2171]
MSIFYYFSISLQIAGSLILLISNFSTNRKKIIKDIYNTNKIINADGNTKEIDDLTGVLKDRFKQVYLNRFAFGYLAIGYILEFIFMQNNSYNKIFAIITITLITVSFLGLSYSVTYKYLLNKDIVTQNISYKELNDLNLKPHLESMSCEELIKILDGDAK